jgi:hypothetical protein
LDRNSSTLGAVQESSNISIGLFAEGGEYLPLGVVVSERALSCHPGANMPRLASNFTIGATFAISLDLE